MDNKDLYWLAGLLEGEGSFTKPAPSAPGRPRIQLEMNDLDVIQRAAGFFGTTYIYQPKVEKAHWHQSYKILTRGKRAIALMHLLYPLMGERRKQQIERAINERPVTEYASSDEDWFYWLTGLLEGEGSFMKSTVLKPHKIRIHLKMTDEDIVRKAANLFGINYAGPYQLKEYKPFYVVLVFGKRAMTWMQQLRPLMGQRRQAQIDAAMASYAPKGLAIAERNASTKLTVEQVRTIKNRLAAGEKLTALAREYKVDQGLIWQIKAGRIWRHVTTE